ncbi:beta-L-arabinofuranosidase domain-containing protein [Microbacterium murale]|uniref:Beta-L-arabinofuranosidase (Glycosyl hydrolase family 127) n=1 Tax=Microbacterium murale TaxID=1081040 RepID=A0ABQ1S163_9MICO|nr:beta-L-arabinofuranosidase domain-containing protein [Microbacterium murale]GGD86226.1 hypothetical protein GCM10007269_31390 [Microbacterium murale]
MSDRPSAALAELPLGAVRPSGWLVRQLRLQADNITGRLEDIWPDVGVTSAWKGGDGEDWERGPYYLDGLVPLAWVLDDSDLKSRAMPWIEWMLSSQTGDGQFGPSTSDDWWPRMVALKALTQYADATGDERVEGFIERYARYQLENLPARPLISWGAVRGADNALSIWWLHDRRPSDELRRLALLLEEQTVDWHRALTTDLPEGKVHRFQHVTHGPNVAMGLRAEAAWYLSDGDAARAVRPIEQIEQLRLLHGQAHGWFSGDEWLGGTEATQGIETCQVVESMFSAATNLRVFGDATWGDELELLAFNHLPACSDPEMRGHQYLQQPNQIAATVARRGWSYSTDDANIFGLEPHFGCCTANLHQGWPKFVRSLWLADGDRLVAVSYAPCTVAATWGGREIRVDVETDYPFEEEVRLRIRTGASGTVDGALALRIPAWCDDPSLTAAGEPFELRPREGFADVHREWSDGDELVLRLPQRIRTIDRPRGAVAVRLGPLVMSLSPGENWLSVPAAPGIGEWHVTRRTNWNLGLVVDGPRGRESWRTGRGAVGALPFHRSAPPVSIDVMAGQIPSWADDGADASPPPQSPDPSWVVVEPNRLVPYGSARLRITELPVLALRGEGSEE